MPQPLRQVMANAAVLKLHNPKLALADKLTSQDGSNAVGSAYAQDAHKHTVGAHTTNDCVESNFGTFDHVLRVSGTISVESASAVALQMRMRHFERPDAIVHDRRKAKEGGGAARQKGFFYTLPEAVQEAIIEAARQLRRESRKWARADRQEQLDYKKVRREQNQKKQLEALIDKSATMSEYFTLWWHQRKRSMTAVNETLASLGSATKKHEFLREQIEMRVLGLGWETFKISWTKKGKPTPQETLIERLQKIMTDEIAEGRLKRLPKSLDDVPLPMMRAKTLKQLGTPTCDMTEMLTTSFFSAEQIVAARDKERARREAVGLVDSVQDRQGEKPEVSTLQGKWLEINWKYKHKETHEPILIWCAGQVVKVADGVNDMSSNRKNATKG